MVQLVSKARYAYRWYIYCYSRRGYIRAIPAICAGCMIKGYCTVGQCNNSDHNAVCAIQNADHVTCTTCSRIGSHYSIITGHIEQAHIQRIGSAGTHPCSTYRYTRMVYPVRNSCIRPVRQNNMNTCIAGTIKTGYYLAGNCHNVYVRQRVDSYCYTAWRAPAARRSFSPEVVGT